MSYLLRLARRAAGLTQCNSLKPNIRRWGESLDNIQTWTLSHPNSIQYQQDGNGNVSKQNNVLLSHSNVQNIPSVKSEIKNEDPIQDRKTSIKSNLHGKKTSKDDQFAHSKKTASAFKQTSQNLYHNEEGIASHNTSEIKIDLTQPQPTPLIQPKNIKIEPVKKDTPSLLNQPNNKEDLKSHDNIIQSPERKQTKIETTSNKDDFLKQASPRIEMANQTTLSTINQKYRKLTPVNSQKQSSPKLVIGTLKVDVIPVMKKSKTQSLTKSTAKINKRKRQRAISWQTVKLRFGFGQM